VEFAKLAYRNLLKHPMRSILTVLSLMIAVFLLCTLRTLVVALNVDPGIPGANRLWVQSAVSLFVDLPIAYQGKIEGVEGVTQSSKYQWFGGYYRDPADFFAQFAVDGDEMFELYPELSMKVGSLEDWTGRRDACIVGQPLLDRFDDWEVGKPIPLIGPLFPHPDGVDAPWEFYLAGVYEASVPTFDQNQLFFNWDYFEETLEGTEMGAPGSGTFVLGVEPGVEKTRVMADIDALFENGPQRVQTTTEAEFVAQFVSMYGNVGFFVASIGGAVLLAILLACINTMLMAGREQTNDIGILKALGFTDSRVFRLMLAQSLVLCGIGGGLGIGLALFMDGGMATAMAAMFPAYGISVETLVMAVIATILIGLIAGVVPAWRASRMRVVQAFGEVF